MNSTLHALIHDSDPVAYAKIYQTYARDLYQHALRRVKDESVAEDILQELFIQLWERRARLSSETNLRSYLFAAIKYKIYDYYLHEKSQRQHLDALAESLRNHAQENREFLETYIALEELLEKELQRMPENMRNILLLRWDKFSIAQIAQKLNLSEQTVKNNISHAKKRLKKKIINFDKPLEMANYLIFLSILFQET